MNLLFDIIECLESDVTRSLVGQNFGQAHHDHKGFVFCFLGEGNPSAQEFNMLSRR